VAVAQGSGGALMLNVGNHSRPNAVNQNRLLVFKKGQYNLTKRINDKSQRDGTASILALGHEAKTDVNIAKNGEKLYARNCSFCHGVNAKGNGVVPDLRVMSEKTHQNFIAIVETEMSFTQKIEYWFTYWGSLLGKRFPWLANATRDYVM